MAVVCGNNDTDRAAHAAKSADDDTARVVQLVQQAVEDNHNTLTQAGKRLILNGHNYASYGLCDHPDCALARRLKFSWESLKREMAAAAEGTK